MSLQAGTQASSSLSDAHTEFLPISAGSVTPGSILCPLEEKRDISNLLSVWKEDVDPRMALAGTCHLGLICDRARTVCWASLPTAAFGGQFSLPASTAGFTCQKGKGLGGSAGLKAECLFLSSPGVFEQALLGLLCLPILRNQS